MMVCWQSAVKIRKYLEKATMRSFLLHFAWDRNSLSHADTVMVVPYLKEKEMVKEMKNGKDAGPSSVRNGKNSKGSKVDIITNLVKQIIGGVTPSEWKLGFNVHCYKLKGVSLEKQETIWI